MKKMEFGIMILGESAVHSTMDFYIRICCPGAKSQQLAWNECNVNAGAGSGCTVKNIRSGRYNC